VPFGMTGFGQADRTERRGGCHGYQVISEVAVVGGAGAVEQKLSERRARARLEPRQQPTANQRADDKL
jgi:hypothetical protein